MTMERIASDSRPLIMLVEDDTSLASTLSAFLRLTGYDVVAVQNGEKALSELAKNQPNIVVLDVLMPGIDGREVLRRLRQSGNWVPVILLTQVSGTAERIMAIEEGADDYLNKPFEPQELVARIKAILRRAQQSPQVLHAAQQLSAESLTIDRLSRRVRLNRQEVVITPKAFAILDYLMTHPDEVVSRERLLDAVWGWENAVGTRVVDTRIVELRKALADDPTQPRFIETLTGQGYRFIPPVSAVKRT
jgi:DNA-binding response OmpR family regulator